jgi:hypothetical protein
MTQDNLATPYICHIRVDRSENVEQAIEHCNQALEVYNQKDFHVYWALTLNNLTLAY